MSRGWWLTLFAFAHTGFQAGAQPQIVQEPQDRAARAGARVGFSVVAQGNLPLRYQWQFNGQDIRNGHGRVLSFFATPSRAGVYSVRVWDSSGSEQTSTPARLEVFPRPAIMVQPKNQIVAEHGTAVFEVQVNDSGPYSTIVWHNANPLEGSHQIPDGIGLDVHSTRLVIPDCNNTDSYNGVYWLALTNAVGGTVTRRARLTVVGPPRLTIQPQDRTVRRGGVAVFSVGIAPDPAGPKTKQWYRDGEPIPGATGRVFRVARLQPEDGGYYYCVVTSRGGSAQSYSAALTVLE